MHIFSFFSLETALPRVEIANFAIIIIKQKIWDISTIIRIHFLVPEIIITLINPLKKLKMLPKLLSHILGRQRFYLKVEEELP